MHRRSTEICVKSLHMALDSLCSGTQTDPMEIDTPSEKATPIAPQNSPEKMHFFPRHSETTRTEKVKRENADLDPDTDKCKKQRLELGYARK